MKNIAIFASGSGSNAEKLMEHFKIHKRGKVALVLSNKPEALVLERAKKFDVKTRIFSRAEFFESDEILNLLKSYNIDLIVLAGFLWLVPQNLIESYSGKIVNIHPALLPKYGGKGMYGNKVHEAVINAREKESGISIHYVNEKFDEGEIIFQAYCNIDDKETNESLSRKIQALEHEHFPKVIEQLL